MSYIGYFKKRKERLQITDDTPEFYPELMKRCRNYNPENRPTAEEIKGCLWEYKKDHVFIVHFWLKFLSTPQKFQNYSWTFCELNIKYFVESKKELTFIISSPTEFRSFSPKFQYYSWTFYELFRSISVACHVKISHVVKYKIFRRK